MNYTVCETVYDLLFVHVVHGGWLELSAST
jgi:hypothetical protein